jgi:hypothetical protein
VSDNAGFLLYRLELGEVLFEHLGFYKSLEFEKCSMLIHSSITDGVKP